MQQLKAELEKAWLMLDAANEKEQRGRETIETLKVEIDNLTKVPFYLNFLEELFSSSNAKNDWKFKFVVKLKILANSRRSRKNEYRLLKSDSERCTDSWGTQILNGTNFFLENLPDRGCSSSGMCLLGECQLGNVR